MGLPHANTYQHPDTHEYPNAYANADTHVDAYHDANPNSYTHTDRNAGDTHRTLPARYLGIAIIAGLVSPATIGTKPSPQLAFTAQISGECQRAFSGGSMGGFPGRHKKMIVPRT